jgi:hypothetical protein
MTRYDLLGIASLLVGACAFPHNACAAKILGEELSITTRIIPEYHRLDDSSTFTLAAPFNPFAEESSRQELELRYAKNGLSSLATTRHTLEKSKKPNYQFLLNELYLDFTFLDEDFSVGKKILSWGVGFGFRPLDVLQRENRRRLYLDTLEGIPSLIWEKFTESGALTLVIANPVRKEKNTTIKSDIKTESIALKYYQLLGDTDLQAVMRWSKVNHFETGSGFTRILNDQMEWHASLLYQQRYLQPINPLASETTTLLANDDPIKNKHFEDGIKTLLGFSWTSDNHWSTLVEAWYDKAAYSSSQWQSMINLTHNQRALIGQTDIPEAAIFGNIAFSSQLFAQTNLLQQNLLVRVSHDSTSFNQSLDFLYTPQDDGWVTTLNFGYSGNAHKIDFSLRYFGGNDNTAYKQLPQQVAALIGWQWAF